MPDNEIIDVLSAGGVTELAVATTGVAYTRAFPLPKNRNFGVEIVFTSPGAVDVKVELEQGNSLPGTQGAADSDDWAVGDSVSAGITNETPNFLEVSPVVSLYGRFKLTGQGSNDAGTKLTRCKLATSQNS
jgi:hypothetical protein